jgi:hypothetical protein
LSTKKAKAVAAGPFEAMKTTKRLLHSESLIDEADAPSATQSLMTWSQADCVAVYNTSLQV